MLKNSLLFVVLLMFCACFAPNEPIPQMSLPVNLTPQASNQGIDERWWEGYGHEPLNKLINEALEKNFDLAIAMERVASARESWNYTTTDRYPNLSIKGEGTRNKAERREKSNRYNNFSLSAVLSFELDLWGRVRDANKSAYATLLAVKANQDLVRLSLIANVAESYFGLVALQEQVSLAKAIVQAREEMLSYRTKELEVGKIPEDLWQRAKSDLGAAQLNLQGLLMEYNSAQSALMLLLGRDPQEIFNASLDFAPLPQVLEIPVGISSQILEQRPDIEIAEQNLRASNFSLGAARSAYFPVISLTGLFGYASNDLNHLLSNSATTWNFGGNFLSSLLDFGRTHTKVKIAQSAYKEAILTYGKVVREAFGEVRNALFNYQSSNEKFIQIQNQLQSAQKILSLQNIRYQEGYVNYLDLLDAKNNFYATKINYLTTHLENLSASISLFKALGGGWNKKTYKDELKD